MLVLLLRYCNSSVRFQYRINNVIRITNRAHSRYRRTKAWRYEMIAQKLLLLLISS